MPQQGIATEKTVRELEFPEVLARVSEHCVSPVGKERVLGLRPGGNGAALEREFRILDEMGSARATQPLSVFTALTPDFCRTVLKPGATLAAEQLVALSVTYDTIHRLQRLAGTRGFQDRHPLLHEAIGALPSHDDLREELHRVLDPDGRVRDQASAALADLRAIQRELKQRVESLLDRLIRNENTRKLLADDYYTVLNDRYVILLKAEHKGRIPGIIQGESASGLSLYLEPLKIVEPNNERIEARVEEAREIRRILRHLSERAHAHRDDYAPMLDRLAWLDSLQARSAWAAAHGAHAPELGPGGPYALREARHPLLGAGAVPVDLVLDPQTRVVLLSGVNSGGKTVAVKLAGLASLMAQSGLPVPAAPGSRLPLYDVIASEIGDQQSLSENLSSFSSHLTHVREILASRRGRCLLVFDEFMTGTDPDEGAALAESILLEVARDPGETFVTTHYGKLKILPQKYPGFMNMAVEFDWERLAPTFRVVPGRPGSSLGIEIAERFGIDPSVAGRARELLDSGQVALNRLVRDLDDELARLKSQQDEARQAIGDAGAAIDRLERALGEARREKDVAIRQAREQFADELEALKARVQQSLTGKPEPDLPRQIHERVREVRRKVEESAPPPTAEVRPGSWVTLPGSREPGLVLEVFRDGKRVRVLVNGIEVTTKLRSLEPAHPPAHRPTGSGTGIGTYRLRDEPVGSEINLVAMRVQEALEALESYLDQAFARNYPEVRVIHGRGTGALRRAVLELLQSSRIVRSHRPGSPEEGGDGATIVSFR